MRASAASSIATWVAASAAASLICTPALADDGLALFNQNCALCHQVGATGLAGQFPRLAGRINVISSKPEGRVYLIDVLTYGLAATIKVDGQDIMGLMPPFAQLPPESVAAILSYLQTLGTPTRTAPTPFSADEVASERGKPGKNSAGLPSERQALEKLKILP